MIKGVFRRLLLVIIVGDLNLTELTVKLICPVMVYMW